jgi:hypothetical protein
MRGVRFGHAGDERSDLGVDGRPTAGRTTRELGPVLTEPASLPPQDGVGGHEHEGLPPAGPDSGQAKPEQAISRAQPGPAYGSLVHGDLVTQGEVLQGELAMAVAEEGEETKQVEHDDDH